jgi:hypothetical protein
MMAELSPKGSDSVLGVFLDAYNRLHGSAYVVKVSEPAADPSCDYLCEDPNRAGVPLKVQLTRATTTVDTTRHANSVQTAPESHQMHAWIHDSEARKLPAVIHDTAADCAARAVLAKLARLGPSADDLVLLVFFDLMRYDESVDLPEMRAAVAAVANGFREVWAVSTFVDERGRADRLWPDSGIEA